MTKIKVCMLSPSRSHSSVTDWSLLFGEEVAWVGSLRSCDLGRYTVFVRAFL